MSAMHFKGDPVLANVAGRRALHLEVEVRSPVVFAPHFAVAVNVGGGVQEVDSIATHYLGWLPRGRYRLEVLLPGVVEAGSAQVSVEARHEHQLAQAVGASANWNLTLPAAGADTSSTFTFSLAAIAPTPPLESLSWKRGHADWFFQHFDHASSTIVAYMLANDPKLRGRVLDLGCGDGITALGVALRSGCSELIGIDPFKGYERLPGIVAANHLPADAIPACLRFLPEDANAMGFPDNHFDVVVSWASVEHFAGGYLPALAEVRRVLKPGGLFFVHPGLYYTKYGHHLGEFSSEPYFHMTHSEAEVERIVLETPPNRIDRAGEIPTPAQNLQWYRELNRITVPQFEAELRSLDFEPWRLALRSENMVEYTPGLQAYSMVDLAIGELYVSCINRKPR